MSLERLYFKAKDEIELVRDIRKTKNKNRISYNFDSWNAK